MRPPTGRRGPHGLRARRARAPGPPIVDGTAAVAAAARSGRRGQARARVHRRGVRRPSRPALPSSTTRRRRCRLRRRQGRRRGVVLDLDPARRRPTSLSWSGRPAAGAPARTRRWPATPASPLHDELAARPRSTTWPRRWSSCAARATATTARAATATTTGRSATVARGVTARRTWRVRRPSAGGRGGGGGLAGVLHVAGADALSRHEFGALLSDRPVRGAPAPPAARSTAASTRRSAAGLLRTRLRGAREVWTAARPGPPR